MPAQQYSDETNPFAVRPDSDVPVGVQLNWRLRTLILTGRLRSGETLPSVRRLANWAGVNANTVRAVYDALQDDGLITSQQGRGTFVADEARPKLGLEAIVLDTVRRGQESGTGPRDLADRADGLCRHARHGGRRGGSSGFGSRSRSAARRSRFDRSCAVRSPSWSPSCPPTCVIFRLATCRPPRPGPTGTSPASRSSSGSATSSSPSSSRRGGRPRNGRGAKARREPTAERRPRQGRWRRRWAGGARRWSREGHDPRVPRATESAAGTTSANFTVSAN